MLNESTVFETSDGSLYLNLRCQFEGYRVISRSPDGGMTWNHPVIDPNLPDPTCQACVIRLPDENSKQRVLFSNLAKGGPHTRESRPSRDHLTVRMSYDEGNTWPVSRLIHSGPSGYSDMAYEEDSIYLIFENGTESYRDKLSLLRFNLSWLTEG